MCVDADSCAPKKTSIVDKEAQTTESAFLEQRLCVYAAGNQGRERINELATLLAPRQLPVLTGSSLWSFRPATFLRQPLEVMVAVLRDEWLLERCLAECLQPRVDNNQLQTHYSGLKQPFFNFSTRGAPLKRREWSCKTPSSGSWTWGIPASSCRPNLPIALQLRAGTKPFPDAPAAMQGLAPKQPPRRGQDRRGQLAHHCPGGEDAH